MMSNDHHLHVLLVQQVICTNADSIDMYVIDLELEGTDAEALGILGGRRGRGCCHPQSVEVVDVQQVASHIAVPSRSDIYLIIPLIIIIIIIMEVQVTLHIAEEC